MKFFGLEINDILVSFILTLIVGGAITYFCHMRLKNIENAVTKQNQVLSSFITNVKDEINPTFSVSSALTDSASTESASTVISSMGLVSTGLASFEAIKAVAALDKIEVSDDSSSDSETDSETEDDSDEDIKLSDMNLGNLYDISQDDIKIIDLICIPQQKYNSTESTNNSKIIEIFDVNTSDTDSDDESEDEIIVKKIVEIVPPVEEKPIEEKPIEVTLVEEKPIPVEEKPVEEKPVEAKPIEVTLIEAKPVELIEISNEDLDTSFIKKIHTTHDDGETKLEKLKIEDLRHLAVTKGLGSKDEVKKIKKPELIALLEKV